MNLWLLWIGYLCFELGAKDWKQEMQQHQQSPFIGFVKTRCINTGRGIKGIHCMMNVRLLQRIQVLVYAQETEASYYLLCHLWGKMRCLKQGGCHSGRNGWKRWWRWRRGRHRRSREDRGIGIWRRRKRRHPALSFAGCWEIIRAASERQHW